MNEYQEKICENIMEITMVFCAHEVLGDIVGLAWSKKNELIKKFAVKFEEEYENEDWHQSDYRIEIRKFANLSIAKMLWESFEDVPMNPEKGILEEKWNCFPKGACKYDI